MARLPELAGVILGLALAGCSPSDQGVRPAGETRATALQAGYGIPPMPVGVRRDGEDLVISGRAAPEARVRLATPAGEARFSQADGAGTWVLRIPVSSQARLFGLSSIIGTQTVQAQGYFLVTPAGQGVLLRAGAGAHRFDPGRSGILAVDFDGEGGALVSGIAGAGEGLTLRVDGRQPVEGRAGVDGRFSIALSQPISAGPHEIRIFGNRADWRVSFEARPAAPIAEGPYRVQPVSRGLRVDWMTPGGGVQTTILID